MTEQELLIASYRSGQISERQWQDHTQEDPTLRDAWLNQINPDNSGWNPLG
tara:strand:- start:123 stop:275 length:153 start_codon:yes stop_codon:yes gene_type:complete